MSRAFAPGRVNLIGDHTDYVGGLALPCAIDLGITAEFDLGGDAIQLTSDATAEAAIFALSDATEPSATATTWERLVWSVARDARPAQGVRGRLSTTLPIGSGLSSSAACTIALLLTLGFEGGAQPLVLAAQSAEQRATRVPCGVLDQMAIVHGRAGHATMINASDLDATLAPLPERVAIVVVPSGRQRVLGETPYAQRRAEAEAASAALGGLAAATLAAADSLEDPVLRKRARHVVTENARVRAVAEAFAQDDAHRAGALMRESHESLRRDAQVSTHDLDSLVDALSSRPGVYGARLTGAGFGGSVVALVERPRASMVAQTFGGRVVTPSDGARRID